MVVIIGRTNTVFDLVRSKIVQVKCMCIMGNFDSKTLKKQKANLSIRMQRHSFHPLYFIQPNFEKRKKLVFMVNYYKTLPKRSDILFMKNVTSCPSIRALI